MSYLKTLKNSRPLPDFEEYVIDTVDDAGFIEVKNKKSGGINGGTINLRPVSVKPKPIYHPKLNPLTREASPKTALPTDKKKVSTTGNSSKKTSQTNALTSGNGTFSISNLFDALNVDKSVVEDVVLGVKMFMSSVHEKGKSTTSLVEKINIVEQ
ncbi:hypothetical protein Tco_0304179 [Tanacetum coccineum]